jgi:hypothetical protein
MGGAGAGKFPGELLSYQRGEPSIRVEIAHSAIVYEGKQGKSEGGIAVSKTPSLTSCSFPPLPHPIRPV